jgi:hypothetical protein
MSASIALGAALLSTLVREPRAWRHWPPGSEQRPPVYLGLSPLEVEKGLPPRGAVLPARLRAEGEAAFAKLAAALPPGPVELEAWPVPDDYSRPSWQVSRWRAPGGAWRWLDSVPVYHPRVDAQRKQVFDDFSRQPGLYDKPVFGDCVWTTQDGARAAGGWLPLDKRESFERAAVGEDLVCRLLGQPARVDGKPAAFVVSVDSGAVGWPSGIRWQDEARGQAAPTAASRPVAFEPDFTTALAADVVALDGEEEARFPLGRVLRFTRRTASDPDHQLEAVADFLTQRYRALGLTVRREPFVWRGLKQSNVMAVVKGRGPGAADKPVVLVDHYDTAFAEDVFEASGKRLSAPGADDDATGTAALLRAGAFFARNRPRRDVWLLHLTGEEFPGDDLGARKFLSRVLKGRREFTGFIVLDMLGHRNAGDGLFQVNPGRAPGSEALASALLSLSSATVEPWMTPALRLPDDSYSYLYNTDGQLFSDAGYPVVLLNEHLNRLENYGRPGHHRPGYHRTDDVAAGVDFAYAAALAKLAIAAAWTLAN